jgi:hypothetical protein
VRQPPWFRASNNVIKYTTEELLNIATNEEVAEPLLVPSGREAIPSSSWVAPPSIAIQGAKKEAKGDMKRQKQCYWWVAVVADYNDDDEKKADNSYREYVMAVGRSMKRQVWPPTDHVEGLLALQESLKLLSTRGRSGRRS